MIGYNLYTIKENYKVDNMKSSNASSSAFGWDFQSNAAIVLMLKNIERAAKVKVEGKTEDIEITFSDGKILMSQAKSVGRPDDFTNVKRNLVKGLGTLNNAAKINDVEQLIFITNSPNPFNDITTMYNFSSPFNFATYSELPENCQQVITEICIDKGYDFHKENLTDFFETLSKIDDINVD